ncbi:MAG: nicotinate-nicotinamide nucleotide adenylyltransferase [Polyangiaceae bacterium]
MGETTVVFGGSFNPPHAAHVLAACLAKSYLAPAKILVIPTFQHPFGKGLAPFEHRARMCELAMDWIPGLEVSRVERDLGGESKTLWTLKHLATQLPNASFRLLLGADIMLEAAKWFAFDEVVKLAPPFVIGRVGFPHPHAMAPVLPEISSSEIRNAFEHGRMEALEEWLPPKVLAYAREHALYTKEG